MKWNASADWMMPVNLNRNVDGLSAGLGYLYWSHLCNMESFLFVLRD